MNKESAALNLIDLKESDAENKENKKSHVEIDKESNSDIEMDEDKNNVRIGDEVDEDEEVRLTMIANQKLAAESSTTLNKTEQVTQVDALNEEVNQTQMETSSDLDQVNSTNG